jgi:hypothetical protein
MKRGRGEDLAHSTLGSGCEIETAFVRSQKVSAGTQEGAMYGLSISVFWHVCMLYVCMYQAACMYA